MRSGDVVSVYLTVSIFACLFHRRRPPDQRRRLALAARGALQRRRLALVQACAAAQQGGGAGGGEGLKVRERRPAAAGDQPGGEVGVAVAVRDLLGRAKGRHSGAGGAVGGEELGDLEVAPVARDEQRRGASVPGFVELVVCCCGGASLHNDCENAVEHGQIYCHHNHHEKQGCPISLLNDGFAQSAGFWIENGEIQHAIDEFTIASNLRDMFMGIQAVANNIETRSSTRTGAVWIDNMMVAS